MAKIDLEWNDDDVLPPVLSPDTEFVFRRMTEETLGAVQSGNGHRILDVGCGRAIDAASMAERGGMLFGCEPSRVMLRKAKSWLVETGQTVMLISAVGEHLPFARNVFSRVVCKGAIDHFGNPDDAVAEMCRVTGSDGRIVLSVANFESLSCSLARKLNRVFRLFFRKDIPGPHVWEIPTDHTFKFDYRSVLALTKRHFTVERVKGVSLLWGFPKWASTVKLLPPRIRLILLKGMDRIASWFPGWSDVLIISGRPIKRVRET